MLIRKISSGDLRGQVTLFGSYLPIVWDQANPSPVRYPSEARSNLSDAL